VVYSDSLQKKTTLTKWEVLRRVLLSYLLLTKQLNWLLQFRFNSLEGLVN